MSSPVESQKEYDIQEPIYTWQHELIKIVNETPDRRKIIWVYDDEGATGKTDLALWMTFGYKQSKEAPEENKWLAMRYLERPLHRSKTVEVAINDGWKSHGYILDLTRIARCDFTIYEHIADVKDGCVTSFNRTIIFEKPWVVIFANWFPKIEFISLDRWMIYKIVKSESNGKLDYNWEKIDITKE